MTKSQNRTRPLDRDGDGRDGGSLPGNQTAPMATIWTRDNARLIVKLQIIQATLDPALTDATMTDVIDGWTDAEAQCAEEFADAMAAPGRYQDEAGDERNADGSSILLPGILGRFLIGEEQTPPEQPAVDDLADARTTPGDSPEKLEAIEREVDEANAAAETRNDALDAIAEAEPELVAQVINDHGDGEEADTFTAEEVAAAMAQVIEAEGEAPAVDAEPIVIPTDDPLVQIETETAPIAVRERELRLLLDARRLYKSKMPSGDWGYSSNYGAPYVDEATVQGWVAADLAYLEPSAGTWGGVKPTHEARRQLGLIVHGAAD